MRISHILKARINRKTHAPSQGGHLLSQSYLRLGMLPAARATQRYQSSCMRRAATPPASKLGTVQAVGRGTVHSRSCDTQEHTGSVGLYCSAAMVLLRLEFS
jgi:hypothetical protein